MIRLTLLGCILLISFRTLSVEVSPFIVNGSDASISNYPSFASLFYRNGGMYSTSPYCGATMINDQYVLTAAHCIYDDNNLMLYTVVAPQLEDKSYFLSNQQSRAQAFYYPDNYQDSEIELWPNDIAIIKLETPLMISDYSALLNSTINNAFSSMDTYKTIGHGYIEGNVPSGSRLLETDLNYVSTATCQAVFGSKITSSQLCFDGALDGNYKNSTCSGDSGGPVYWLHGSQYIQIGITSFGPSICGNKDINVTSIFTDVYDYRGWITRVINGLEVPKAYVTTNNGVRVLVNNDAIANVSVSPSSGDSGGSIPPFNLWLLSLIILSRYQKNWVL